MQNTEIDQKLENQFAQECPICNQPYMYVKRLQWVCSLTQWRAFLRFCVFFLLRPRMGWYIRVFIDISVLSTTKSTKTDQNHRSLKSDWTKYDIICHLGPFPNDFRVPTKYPGKIDPQMLISLFEPISDHCVSWKCWKPVKNGQKISGSKSRKNGSRMLLDLFSGVYTAVYSS